MHPAGEFLYVVLNICA